MVQYVRITKVFNLKRDRDNILSDTLICFFYEHKSRDLLWGLFYRLQRHICLLFIFFEIN